MGRFVRFQWNQEGDQGILSKLVLQNTGKSKEMGRHNRLTSYQMTVSIKSLPTQKSPGVSTFTAGFYQT